MKKAVKNIKQAGIGLVELLIVLVVAGGLIVAVLARQEKAENKRLANETASSISTAVATIRTIRSPSGTYAGLTPTEVNNMNLVEKPMTWNAGTSTINDAWGNPVGFIGNAAAARGTFVVTLGGTVDPLDPEVCNLIASQLVQTADVVHVGASTTVTTTNGLVSAGSVYKAAGGQPDGSALATGCAATNPVIAFQYH